MVAPAALLWLIPSTFVIPIVLACTAGAFVESALSPPSKRAASSTTTP